MVFSGTVESDFLKLVAVEPAKKENLINYGATEFTDLRAALINYIKAVYPLDYQNFIESDLGVMLIEQVAYMGAVLSFKADMLANENFLRTARKRESVKKLMELIGVRMRGPLAAAADAKLTFSSPTWTSGSPTELTITPANRAFTVTSPEDGAPINFTLYKVVNGLVDLANDTGNIVLNTSSEGETADGVDFRNLVILEGALIQESGEFIDPEITKVINLNQSPVIEGSVEVFIEGDANTSGVYTQVDNIFSASGASDKVFQLVTTDDFKATVVFGDNTIGRAPNVGDTYRINYRVGGGSRGNIANEIINVTVNTAVTTPAGAIDGTLENISQGVGGADAETIDHAKRYGPLTFRRQDRLVTLPDFKAFANNYISDSGSTGKATASTRRAFSSANVIDVHLLEKANDFQLRKATPTFKLQMLTAMNAQKMLTDEIVIVDGLIRTLDLAITIHVDRELKPQEEQLKLRTKDIVLDYFKVDNNDFGKEFVPGDLNRRIFGQEEVRLSTVDNVIDPIRVTFREIIQLNNLAISVNFV